MTPGVVVVVVIVAGLIDSYDLAGRTGMGSSIVGVVVRWRVLIGGGTSERERRCGSTDDDDDWYGSMIKRGSGRNEPSEPFFEPDDELVLPVSEEIVPLVDPIASHGSS